MRISASLTHAPGQHRVVLRTGDAEHTLPVAPKASGGGSATNGGEFLMLALATCYCNDLYREAARLGVVLERVEVQAEAEFAGIGLAARDVRYRARVQSPAPPDTIARLLRETDAVAEVHNTLRQGVPVQWIDGGPPETTLPMTHSIEHQEAGSTGAFFIQQAGERLAEMTYSRTNPTLIIIDHTQVDERLKGQGAGRQLLDALVAWARETKTRVVALCPFAKAQFDKDPSIRDVLV